MIWQERIRMSSNDSERKSRPGTQWTGNDALWVYVEHLTTNESNI